MAIVWMSGVERSSIKDRANNLGSQHARGLVVSQGISNTHLSLVLPTTRKPFRPVFDIIQTSSPTKIVFDGRMDYAELFHGHDIPICGVLDLQLADIYSRRLSGEDEEDQRRRLSTFLKRGEVVGNSKCYIHVQKLCSTSTG